MNKKYMVKFQGSDLFVVSGRNKVDALDNFVDLLSVYEFQEHLKTETGAKA